MPNVNPRPGYSASHALVIGINEYRSGPPLRHAVDDARAVAKILETKLAFTPGSTHVLVDGDATQSAIRQRFLSYANDGTEDDDRLLFFFAGHGLTLPSRKGDVGFLVPYDGDASDVSTLIRWDEFTRNVDLIAAKHVLFLMDACYGGLATTRALQPGAMRFLKDMLLRRARQVLTAGKANEAVADLGGPLPGHSVFTGHLLEALAGKASNDDGILTANGVMAYVYRKVGRDSDSRQTPHFGYLDGDGDFVFSPEKLAVPQGDDEQRTDEDTLVLVPAAVGDEETQAMNVVEQAKDLLSDGRSRIRLHDLVAGEVRRVLSLTAEDRFPVTGGASPAEFAETLQRYEDSTKSLQALQVLLAYWGTPVAFPAQGQSWGGWFQDRWQRTEGAGRILAALG